MYALVGDVVASRRYVDEGALLTALHDALGRVNRRVTALQPLELVVRDEFHGAYATAADAVEATLRLRLATGELHLATDDGEDEPLDVRVGIGQGGNLLSGAGTSTGSAWFHARDARDAAQDLPSRAKWPPSLRTVCHGDDPVVVAGLNAYLLCQDQLYARMDARDRRALRGLLDGERQVDVAAELGVTQPAIARRVKDRGALAVHQALVALRAATPTPDLPTMPGERAATPSTAPVDPTAHPH